MLASETLQPGTVGTSAFVHAFLNAVQQLSLVQVAVPLGVQLVVDGHGFKHSKLLGFRKKPLQKFSQIDLVGRPKSLR